MIASKEDGLDLSTSDGNAHVDHLDHDTRLSSFY
jgi:hypothetical protein